MTGVGDVGQGRCGRGPVPVVGAEHHVGVEHDDAGGHDEDDDGAGEHDEEEREQAGGGRGDRGLAREVDGHGGHAGVVHAGHGDAHDHTGAEAGPQGVDGDRPPQCRRGGGGGGGGEEGGEPRGGGVVGGAAVGGGGAPPGVGRAPHAEPGDGAR